MDRTELLCNNGTSVQLVEDLVYWRASIKIVQNFLRYVTSILIETCHVLMNTGELARNTDALTSATYTEHCIKHSIAALYYSFMVLGNSDAMESLNMLRATENN